ncbi:MAG TPA: TolC family protein [Burkholderiales bacterium]|nr:TolC family protein [Burkholderiales bacterium]
MRLFCACLSVRRLSRALLCSVIGLTAAQSSPSAALTLAEAEKLLLAKNHDLAAAQQTLEAVEANVVVAGAHPNPTLSAQSVKISPQRGVGSGPFYDKPNVDTTVSISQLIERGDKVRWRTEIAKGQAMGVRNDLADLHRQLRLALYSAYYDLKLAEEKAALALETSGLYAQALAAADKRLAAGDIAPVERARLTVEALRAQSDAETIRADTLRAQETLALLIGQETQAQSLYAEDPWPNISGIQPLSAEQFDALGRRPDVRAAQARIEAAQAARELAKSLRTRDVTLGAQVERFRFEEPGVSYGLSVNIPLFVHYYYEGEIARAEADYGAALVARDKVLATAKSELAKTYASLRAAAERTTRMQEYVLPAAKRAADGVEFAYAHGAATLTDVLDARRTLRATLLDLANARADYAKALAAWMAATELKTDTP